MGLVQAQMVRDYVQFSMRPFTTKDIETATEVNRKVSSGVLKKLVTAGIVKILQAQNNSNIYVRRAHAGGRIPSTKEQVLAYAQNSEKAFCTGDIRMITGCTYAQAKYHLAELARQKKISLVSVDSQVKRYVWGDSTQNPQDTPSRLWQAIKENPNASQSELIKITRLSRSAVERWLRVFRDEQIVTFTKQNHNTFNYRNIANELPEFKTLKEYGVR